MTLINDENILKLLYSFNPWWKTGSIQKEFVKPVKRFAFYEATKLFEHREIRRTVLLTGARRTGKTTILFQMMDILLEKGVSPKSVLFLSFDHPMLKMCSFDTILNVYRQNICDSQKIFCFFDEIQYAENWDRWLKFLYDTEPLVRIAATGSASPVLQNKATESGVGRWTVVAVPTLSFFEYCAILQLPERPQLSKNLKPTQIYQLSQQEQNGLFQSLSSLQIHFLRYLQVGGFPELALSKDDVFAQRILREDIVDKALKRDLPTIYGIRSVTELERIFLYLCYYSSNVINIEAVSKEIGQISRVTVEKYISYLESANLIYVSRPVELGGKKILKAKSKIYIADAAIRNAVLMSEDMIANAGEWGLLVETAVYKHVKTFYYNAAVQVGYFRESSDKEIDIVVKLSPSTNILIEVKYREQDRIKESDAIVSQADERWPGLVITKKEQDFGMAEYGTKKIYKIPAFAFLYLLGHAENEGYKKHGDEDVFELDSIDIESEEDTI